MTTFLQSLKQLFFALLLVIATSCGTGNSLSKYPPLDRGVYELINQAKKDKVPVNANLLKQYYETAVDDHLQKIRQYNNSSSENRWENILKEYDYLHKLADAVALVPNAGSIKVQRFYDEYSLAKEKVLSNKYETALSLLDNNDRQDAQKAYNLLREVNRMEPGYKDVNTLVKHAERASVLIVVINPVNYYSQSYNYWGLNNDYIQQQMVTDLKNQLSSGNVKVYAEYEARNRQIVPDRLVDISWNELFVPIPNTHTNSRQVSKEIQTGTTTDNKPIYTTVTATVIVVQKTVRARGNLELKITDPVNGRTVLWDQFPAQYNWQEEYATYQGDSRALSAADLALINRANSNINDPTRYELYDQVFKQAYPRLLSRIRSVTW